MCKGYSEIKFQFKENETEHWFEGNFKWIVVANMGRLFDHYC